MELEDHLKTERYYTFIDTLKIREKIDCHFRMHNTTREKSK